MQPVYQDIDLVLGECNLLTQLKSIHTLHDNGQGLQTAANGLQSLKQSHPVCICYFLHCLTP